MRHIFFFFILSVALFSCKSQSNYTKACASSPNPSLKNGSVSGKQIAIKRVRSNSYRNFARRPHKLGLLRK